MKRPKKRPTTENVAPRATARMPGYGVGGAASAITRFLPALLFILVLATFSPCLWNGFVNFDDQGYVTNNAHVRQGLTWEGLRWIWGDTDSSNWHPLTWISHMLDVDLFGLAPPGHHATSVLLHAVNTTLLFVVLGQMTGAMWRSFVVAAFFGLHPLRVESVAWVSERKDVLSGLCWMLTMWAYIRYAHREGAPRSSAKADYGLTLFFFALGLLSKPMVVTLPFALLLLDFWPLRRWPRQSVRALCLEKIPFLILAAASSVITFLEQAHGNSVTSASTLELPARLANAAISYVRYLGKTFWPTDLCVMYPHPGHWPVEITTLAVTVLAALTALVVWKWRTMPYLAVGWLWFIGTLTPAIGLVQVGRQAMADRYTYIPSIGLWIAVVWGAGKLTERWNRRENFFRAAVPAALAICIVLTIHQIGFWRNTKTLFERALNVTQRNWIVAGALADELQRGGQISEAIAMYQETIRINPYHNEIRFKLGKLFLEQKRPQEALALFQEAVEREPKDIDAHKGLGASFQDLGRLDAAIDQFNEVIRLKPDDPDAYSNLGNCHGMKGQPVEAVHCFEQAVKLQPNLAANHRDLGVGLANQGRWDEAIAQFQQALALDPKDPQARQDLAAALLDKAKGGPGQPDITR